MPLVLKSSIQTQLPNIPAHANHIFFYPHPTALWVQYACQLPSRDNFGLLISFAIAER